jgi:hypothetical protein
MDRPAFARTTTRIITAFVLDPDGNNIEAVCHGRLSGLAAAVWSYGSPAFANPSTMRWKSRGSL